MNKDLQSKKYSIVHVVGEIFPDENVDDPAFSICGSQDRILQYYAFSEKAYDGKKSAIIKAFEEKYQPPENLSESGLVRIRFVVNCNGEAGRFRLLGANTEYQPFTFSEEITSQLMTITKSLSGWKSMEVKGKTYDYYQYLTFKIEEGQLKEILP